MKPIATTLVSILTMSLFLAFGSASAATAPLPGIKKQTFIERLAATVQPHDELDQTLLIILAVLLPPLAVGLKTGFVSRQFKRNALIYLIAVVGIGVLRVFLDVFFNIPFIDTLLWLLIIVGVVYCILDAYKIVTNRTTTPKK